MDGFKVNLKEDYFKIKEEEMNKNKKWYNPRIRFTERDIILVKLGYAQAIKDMNEILTGVKK